MKYVVSVSGGAGSTIAAHRAVEKHGEDAVVLLFADTNSEDPSLYESIRYMRDVALKGVEFWWFNDGRNIWDVFNQYGFIRGVGGCKASLILKRQVLDNFIKDNWSPGQCTCVTGLGWDEEDRIARFDKSKAPHLTWHPLTEKPWLTHQQEVELVNSWGYPRQLMYEMGYPHNNCGGGCVLAGISQWVGLYHDQPERFKYHRDQEAAFRERTGTSFTILKDRRGGVFKPLPLVDLEQRILSNDLNNLVEFRSTCACMTPGEEDETTPSENRSQAAQD